MNRIRSTLGPRDRRAVLVGAIVLGPALLFHLAIRPYAGAVSTLRDRLVSERALLGRERDLLARVERDRAAGVRLVARLRTDRRRLLRSGDARVAAAELAEYVDAVGQASGIRVDVVPAGAAESPGAELAAVPLEVRAAGGLEGVLLLLRRLESGLLLVQIDRLTLSGVDAGGGMPAGTVPANDAASMSLALRLIGFALVDTLADGSASLSSRGVAARLTGSRDPSADQGTGR